MNLLKSIGYEKVAGGIYPNEMRDAWDSLEELMLHNEGAPPRYIAAEAYLIGIRQGIHNERSRRRSVPTPYVGCIRELAGKLSETNQLRLYRLAAHLYINQKQGPDKAKAPGSGANTDESRTQSNNHSIA